MEGSPKLKLNTLSTGTTVGAIFGTGGVATAIYFLFAYPYYKRKLVYEDWTLKWYDIFRGPIYWFKSTDNIPPIPEGQTLTKDYYKGRRYDEAGNLVVLQTDRDVSAGVVEAHDGEDSNSDGEKHLLLSKTNLPQLILKNNLPHLLLVLLNTKVKTQDGQINLLVTLNWSKNHQRTGH